MAASAATITGAEAGAMSRFAIFPIQAPCQAQGETMGEAAFQMLRTAILCGVLKPGERLKLEDLARAIGMSRMPVREALARLSRTGLIEILPRNCAYVAPLSQADLKDVYDTRLALEVPAIVAAAKVFDDQDYAIGLELLDQFGVALGEKNEVETLKAHAKFHFALYRQASSRRFARVMSPLWDTSERYRVAACHFKIRSVQTRINEHKRLLGACQAGDASLAAAELWNHLVRTANLVSAQLGGEPIYERKAVPSVHVATDLTSPVVLKKGRKFEQRSAEGACG